LIGIIYKDKKDLHYEGQGKIAGNFIAYK